MDVNIIREIEEEIATMRNRPQKLLSPKLFDDTLVLWSGQLFCFPNHSFSALIILPPSVKFRIALDISGTSGEPIGNACDFQKPPFSGYVKNFTHFYNCYYNYF